ncbi:hypothetical protein [Mycetocola miduiensis]|uniref:Uncharacterized protein n=1 Tax=Mycetocola miduiensis TaxID=995034 RepID=A0A1I5AVB3_9MICO|nr:hypothetical protein [Mycetocola miduiensis]SFN66398.1 hypothetical protein SAMN05216219_1564 [Mycetocola miduiensis]
MNFWLTAAQYAAALLPIAASLYAGLTLLVRSHQLRRERRVRTHIKEFVMTRDYSFAGGYLEVQKYERELDLKLQRAYGLPEPTKTRILDFNVQNEMSEHPMANYQVVNQYILLGAALVLLSLWPFAQAAAVVAN